MSLQNSTSYLDELNPQQRDAVVYTDGPELVIAGAGSGKTRVLTYKIMHLIAQGFEPYRILALTFTNKAAREMKQRVAKTVGEKSASRIWMGTFHSVFLRILRQHADAIGFRHDFTIYDATDSKSLVKSIIKNLELDEKEYKPATISAIISNSKNALVSAAAYRADQHRLKIDERAKRPLTGKIFEIYCNRCRASNAMDFDDILYYMNILLRDNPDILRHYREFFKYILVDEYQDTNFAQHLVISQLAGKDGKLCVVGDDAQSIYSFRGANIANILSLKQSYPTLRIFKLERNYRSTQSIINAAGSLIAKNIHQIPKNVYSENAIGNPITVIKAYSDLEEGALVASGISRSKLTQHDSLEDYVILYRTNAQSRNLEESLRSRNIPYRIYGGVAFYQRKEIKDAICYFRVTVNPDDDEALIRIINYPARGIGETTVKKLRAAAIEGGASVWNVLKEPARFNLDVNKGTQRKLDLFAELIDGFRSEYNKGTDAFKIAQMIFNQSGMLSILSHDSTPEAISRQENLKELLVALKDFVDTRMESEGEAPDISTFLSEVALATDQDSADSDAETEKVTMMTVHAAKGLEFKNVYIVGVEEDLFPSSMSLDNPESIEEERRLLYVAITRAKINCTITYAGSRFRNGATQITRPSRFLHDLDPAYIRMHSSAAKEFEGEQRVDPVGNYNRRNSSFSSNFNRYGCQPTTYSNRSRSGITANSHSTDTASSTATTHTASEVCEGIRIRHSRFGEGIITGIEQSSGETVIHVDFDTMGSRKLLLKFAKFDIIK